jgi:two-component system, OmpR family, sensor histidine kinase BaeS
MWRFGCFLLVALAALITFTVVLAGLVASAFGIVRAGDWLRGVSVLALVVLFLVIAGGARRVGRMAWPMRDLVEGAGKIEAGDYSARVRETGPPELRSVARAFNAMSARLQASDEQRRTFLADLAHELRTPLTVIQGQAEAIGDGVYPGDAAHVAPILDATRTLERLVEDLRTLVLSDAGNLVLNREHLDLGVLAQDAVSSFQSQAESAGFTLSAATSADLPMVDADPARINSVVTNLLSNAVRHTPAGGSIRIAVAPAGDSVALSVTDTGEGITPDLLPHVFERFVKGPSSSGSGLGLAIARDIVTAHGGTIVLESKAGAGTTVRMTLPAVKDATL